jgi:septum formation protein
MTNFVYLASQSPRRSQLLTQIGVLHQLLLPEPDEDAEALEVVLPGEAPAVYVQRVTALKLIAATARFIRASGLKGSENGLDLPCIICADTTVALGRTIYGKPLNAVDAARMLGELSGRTHRVLTAVAVGCGERAFYALSESRVTMSVLSSAQIQAYIDSGEPFGKAGSYAVQGRAAVFIERITGSFSGIMGLPVHETAALLRAAGFSHF